MIYLATYKSTHKGLAGVFNRGVKWLTKSQYSHSEVCIGNPFECPVPCISSTGIEGGVRSKTMQLNPAKWDIVPMPWVRFEDVQRFLDSESGCGYDYAGVARFVFPWAIGPSKTRWFCTEAVAEIAGYPDPWRFSPADFHIICNARNK